MASMFDVSASAFSGGGIAEKLCFVGDEVPGVDMAEEG